MSDADEREHYRRLPEPVETVETVDTTAGPAPDAADERERFLREAGGA